MIGIYFGVIADARPISMKASMNTRKLITFLQVMRSQEKISFVRIWSKCKKNMENNISILSLIHMFYLKNLVTFTLTFKNLNALQEMIKERICGLLSQLICPVVEEST
jgi:hypothetical protein